MIMIASRISSTLATSMAGALVISNYQLSWTDFHIFYWGGAKNVKRGGKLVHCFLLSDSLSWLTSRIYEK